jgi:predicted nucleic acid-binding protein
VSEPIVTDSTCLIGLERIQRLEILPALFKPISAPPEVQREFGVTVPWLGSEIPADYALVTALKMLVDHGEAEAIALAQGQKRRVILDDRRARGIAKNLGIRVIGTVGILMLAKKERVIPAIRPIMNELEATGFYIGAD